jgi:hypothetical protein
MELMKKRKLSALVVSLVLSFSIFTGCASTSEGSAYLNALKKSTSITTAEAEQKVTLDFNVKGLPAEEQMQANIIKGMIDGASVTIKSKVAQNKEGTASKSYYNIDLDAAGFPVNSEVWVNKDFTGETPINKEIIKSEMLLGLVDPKLANKYLVIDLEEMKKMPEYKEQLGNIDYAEMARKNKELQQKVIDYIIKYAGQLDPGFQLISDKGYSTSKINNNDVPVHLYEIKLTDANYKALIREIGTEVNKDKEMLNGIKEILIAAIDAGGVKTKEIDEIKEELDLVFEELGSAEHLTQFNEIMDQLDKIQILGEKGIVSTYAIDNNGYLVSDEGEVQLVFDLKKLNDLSNNLAGIKDSQTAVSGVINLGFRYATKSFNINEPIEINFPDLTKDNSITFPQFMKIILPPVTQPTKPAQPTVAVSKKNSVIYYNKIPYVKAIDVTAKLKGSVTYSKGLVTIKLNGKTLQTKTGSKSIKVNGKNVTLKAASSRIVKNKVYVTVEVIKLAGVVVKIK